MAGKIPLDMARRPADDSGPAAVRCRFEGAVFVARVTAIHPVARATRRHPMRYLLLIYTPEMSEPPSPEATAQEMKAYGAFTQEITDRGLIKAGEALEPTSTATTVRVKDGRTVTTDGPFAETKEALGGFYLIDARDLDEAIEVAAKIPAAQRGSIEVRPIWELPADYPQTATAQAATR